MTGLRRAFSIRMASCSRMAGVSLFCASDSVPLFHLRVRTFCRFPGNSRLDFLLPNKIWLLLFSIEVESTDSTVGSFEEMVQSQNAERAFFARQGFWENHIIWWICQTGDCGAIPHTQKYPLLPSLLEAKLFPIGSSFKRRESNPRFPRYLFFRSPNESG